MNETTDWYETAQINKYSYSIVEGHAYGMFLLIGDDESLVIDAGAGIGDLRGLVDELTVKPPKLLITHSHWDHMGAVSQFDTVLADEREIDPEGRISINGLSDEFTQRPGQFVDQWRDEGNAFPAAFDPETYSIPPSKSGAIEVIEPGDVIDLGGLELDIFDFSGHSPGQLGALDSNAGVLYGSDVIHNGHGLYMHFKHCDVSENVESFERLINLYEEDRFDRLMTSHNEPLEGQELEDMIYRLYDGLCAIVAGEAEYELVDTEWGEARRYVFDDSEVMVDKGFR